MIISTFQFFLQEKKKMKIKFMFVCVAVCGVVVCLWCVGLFFEEMDWFLESENYKHEIQKLEKKNFLMLKKIDEVNIFSLSFSFSLFFFVDFE